MKVNKQRNLIKGGGEMAGRNGVVGKYGKNNEVMRKRERR